MINDIHFPTEPHTKLLERYNILGGKINKFIEFVENKWNT